MGFLNFLIPKWFKEMKNGKPIVVASLKGLASESQMKQAIEVGNDLGYEVQSMNQSGMFWDCPNYTIIFRKVNSKDKTTKRGTINRGRIIQIRDTKTGKIVRKWVEE